MSEKPLKYFGWFAELLPAGTPAPSMRDELRPEAPQPEKQAVVGYLANGWIVMVSPGSRLFDVLEHPGRVVAPPSTYTDGTWIWPEGIAYYVDKYDLSLPTEFLDDMRANGFEVPTMTRDDAIEIMRALTQSPDNRMKFSES